MNYDPNNTLKGKLDKPAAEQLARRLMDQHGLVSWKFKWTDGYRTLGSCSCSRQTIRLSRVFVTNAPTKEVTDTILHEIAHALTPGSGHNAVWKQKCRELGCRPDRCKMIVMPKRWKVACPICKRIFGRNRRHDGYICARCRVPLLWELAA